MHTKIPLTMYSPLFAGADFFIDLGGDVVELEDLNFQLIVIISWGCWDEPHPKWGRPDCPEPYVEKQGYRLDSVYLAKKPHPQLKKAYETTKEVPQNHIISDGGHLYELTAELTDMINDNDWEELERKVIL